MFVPIPCRVRWRISLVVQSPQEHVVQPSVLKISWYINSPLSWARHPMDSLLISVRLSLLNHCRTISHTARWAFLNTNAPIHAVPFWSQDISYITILVMANRQISGTMSILHDADEDIRSKLAASWSLHFVSAFSTMMLQSVRAAANVSTIFGGTSLWPWGKP